MISPPPYSRSLWRGGWCEPLLGNCEGAPGRWRACCPSSARTPRDCSACKIARHYGTTCSGETAGRVSSCERGCESPSSLLQHCEPDCESPRGSFEAARRQTVRQIDCETTTSCETANRTQILSHSATLLRWARQVKAECRVAHEPGVVPSSTPVMRWASAATTAT